MHTAIIVCNHKENPIIQEKCFPSLPKIGVVIKVMTSDFITSSFPTEIVSRDEPAYKRNLGAKRVNDLSSNIKYLCFIDDDVELHPDCIDEMRNYLKEHIMAGMVYATLYKMDNHIKIDTAGSWLSWTGFLIEKYTISKVPYYILSAKSACCMIRRRVFEEVGGFDEDFVMFGEETDLSWRVWHRGYSVLQLPKAVAYHAFGTKLKDDSYYQKRYIHYHGCKNYITMLIKNLQKRHMWVAIINAMIWTFMGIVWLFKKPQIGKWILQGVWYNIRNIRYVWSKRVKRRMLGDEFLFNFIKAKAGMGYFLNRFKEYLVHELHGG